LWKKGDAFKTIRIKLLLGLLAVTLPLISLLIYLNFYAIKIVHDQVAKSNINLISLYMDRIDRDLEQTDKYLLQLAARDLELLTLEQNEQLIKDSYNLARIHLFQKMSYESSNNKSIDYFFVFSETNKDLMLVPGEVIETNYSEREKTKSEITHIVKNGQANKQFQYLKWAHLKTKNNDYLFHIIKTGNVYIGALIDVRKFIVPLRLIDLGKRGQAFLTSDHNEPMSDISLIKENGLNYEYKQNEYTLTGEKNKYLIVGEKSGKGYFNLIVALPEDEVLKKLPFIQRFVSFMSYGSIVFFIIFLLLIRKIILIPINQIVRAMKKLRNGQLETRIAPYATSSEFILMNETFNSMALQIQELKINIYEEQLNHQKAELNRLQLQINPHFFLNSLNIVYYLAQEKDYGLIQELSLCLIRYFRFMFRSNSEFVTLEEELDHTRNYLRIQKLRFPKNLTYSITISDALLKHSIPPLVIHSFAENIIKHAVSLDNEIKIDIKAALKISANHKSISIQIKDTGKGFAPEVLQQLQRNDNLSDETGEHIGIWNVKRRLDLLYKGQAKITFSNQDEHGAVVEMQFPLLHQDADRGGVPIV
jgi:two-component system sensor histidine kinase YesM